MRIDPRRLRRPKTTPHADFWHVLRIGTAIGLILFAVLPRLIG